MPFHDRTDAGRKLAQALAKYKNQRPIVFALPRGGVPVAAGDCTDLSLQEGLSGLFYRGIRALR